MARGNPRAPRRPRSSSSSATRASSTRSSKRSRTPPPRAALRRPRALPRVRPRARANRPCAFCVVERHVNRALAYDSSGGSAPAGGGSSGVGFGAGGVWRARPSVDRWDDHDRAPSFAPHEVFDNLRLLAQHFVRYRQEDAHELLRLTLDAMDRSCLVNCGRPPVGGGSLDPANPARAMPPTVVERVFQGRFRNRVTCGGCGRDSDAHDPFLDVSLELARGVGSVDEAFDAFVAEETLEGENAYECERCGGLRPATKRLTVHEAPAVLVVHLKRFDHWGGKIDARVAFSDVVTLRGRMSDDAEESERPPVYRLYAAIVHAGGSVDGGHYYAYARRIEAGEGADDEGEWYAMDDSSVRRASLAEVREEQAYVLFYERAPGIPPPPHAVAPIESWGRDALGKESARENREDDEGDDAFASGRSTANEPSTGHLATPDPPRVPPPASARAGLAAFDPTGARRRGPRRVRRTRRGRNERAGPGVEPARGRWLRRRSPRRRMRHASGTELSSEIRDHPPPPRFSDSLVMTKTTKTNSGTRTRR